jgi:hypothetical protein
MENLRAPSHVAQGATVLIKDFIKIWLESVCYGNSQLQIERELVAPIMRVQLSDLGRKLKGN